MQSETLTFAAVTSAVPVRSYFTQFISMRMMFKPNILGRVMAAINVYVNINKAVVVGLKPLGLVGR
jgi:hypothetical protein